MQINISGRHIEITDALREFINSKMQRFERHFDNITTMQVTLSVEKQRQIADANLHISGAEVFAQAESEDMYASIDLLIDKIDRQLQKHKGKQEARRQDSVES